MAPPRQRRLVNPPNSPAVGDNDAPLDEDVGDMEDLEATDAPSTSRASSDAAASASATTVVTFNGVKYTSWQEALVTLTRLKGKAQPGSKWAAVEEVVAPDSSFTLKCKACHTRCQLGNPSKWFKEHKFPTDLLG